MAFHPTNRERGFTLVELLVAMAILVLLMGILLSMTDATRKTWTYANAKTEQFRDAQEAFETICRELGQATLNTYMDYQYTTVNGQQIPTSYLRQSELRFISGDAQTLTSLSGVPKGTHAVFFQAPLGVVTDQTDYGNLDRLLNTCGYFIQFGSDKSSWPPFITALTNPIPQRYRFRLMELTQAADSLTLYNFTSGYYIPPSSSSPGVLNCSNYTGTDWFTAPLAATSPPVQPLAENIVALILLPQLPPNDEQAAITSGTLTGPIGTNLAPKYAYSSVVSNADSIIDSKNQLPPVVQVTMVAVDDGSFTRMLAATSGATNPPTQPDFTSQLFSNATKYQSDLNQLQANLLGHTFASGATTYTPQGAAHPPLNYRIFTANVSLKTAKWSREQTN